MPNEQNPTAVIEKPAEPVAQPAAGAEPQTTAEVDAHIRQREEQKKNRRGGIHERIDQLTKTAKEATELAQKAIQQQTQPQPVAAAQPAAVVEDKPDPRPKAEDFAGKDPAELTTAIAAWVVRQQSKIIGAPAQPAAAAQPPATEEIKFDPSDPVHVQLKTELDGFLQVGSEFIKRNPDFNDMLNSAAVRGLTLDTQAQRAIIRLQAPEVAYYLARPENEPTARRLMALDSMSQVIEIGKLAERLKVSPSDFVSSAGNPGTRLQSGNTRGTIPLDELDTDSYLKQRSQDFKAGIRRVR